MQPTLLYVYAGAPIKAIVGRLQVTSCAKSPLQDCLEMSALGDLAPSEISNYAANYADLYVFSVLEYESFKTVLSFESLREQFGFSPPQSFMILSTEGEAAIEKASGLRRGEN